LGKNILQNGKGRKKKKTRIYSLALFRKDKLRDRSKRNPFEEEESLEGGFLSIVKRDHLPKRMKCERNGLRGGGRLLELYL